MALMVIDTNIKELSFFRTCFNTVVDIVIVLRVEYECLEKYLKKFQQ